MEAKKNGIMEKNQALKAKSIFLIKIRIEENQNKRLSKKINCLNSYFRKFSITSVRNEILQNYLAIAKTNYQILNELFLGLATKAKYLISLPHPTQTSQHSN
ncbi:hypothetical protein BpHYR1_044681 [Brachionus plicatilis]|uniref:Uncharacterized protein n=1 Tax=Brachionus plicatilis TaxID=10195 RepID=A0A3M7PU45_BRAPC|nr:hypothetical protein BpHYR1_044681 [Brachionus plicatilis]